MLAAATFASVRSANRSARVAEQALQEQRRPVLVHSRSDDRVEAVPFKGDHWVSVPGGGAAAELEGEVVYLALSLRNVGSGIAVLQAWRPRDGLMKASDTMPPVDEFRQLRRDQYIAGGDVGSWEGAIRDAADPLYGPLLASISERRGFSLDLLYTDQVGGQRTISSFGVLPSEDNGWIAAAGRHWYLDGTAPR